MSRNLAMNVELAHHVHLTEVRRSDQDALVEFLNEREIYDRTLRIPYPYTAADAERWFALIEQMTEQNGQTVCWAVRNAAGKMIGGVGLEASGPGRSHRAEIGYWLAKPFWGRGIMSTVVQAVCREAFEQLGLVKIVAHVFAHNDASARVLEKCGFQQEGYLRQHYLKNGAFIDAKVYGRLK